MKRSTQETLSTFHDMLEAEQRSSDSRGDKGIGAKFGFMAKFIESVLRGIHGGDQAETVLVYKLLAEQISPVVGMTEEEAFGALIELCDEQRLRADDGDESQAPQARPELVERLRENILWITVAYSARQPGNQRPANRREIHITRIGSGGEPVRVEVTHELAWDDLPPKAREKLLEAGAGPATLSYQLFPVTTEEEA